jgi:hypothetical protein
LPAIAAFAAAPTGAGVFAFFFAVRFAVDRELADAPLLRALALRLLLALGFLLALLLRLPAPLVRLLALLLPLLAPLVRLLALLLRLLAPPLLLLPAVLRLPLPLLRLLLAPLLFLFELLRACGMHASWRGRLLVTIRIPVAKNG